MMSLPNQTEWVETVQSKWNSIVGTNIDKILLAFKNIDNIPSESPAFYGDGNCAVKIINTIISNL